MRGLLTACVLLLNAFTPALAQDATFDVIMAGHTIGSVRVLERVYYQEPTRVQAVYSEKFGAMLPGARKEPIMWTYPMASRAFTITGTGNASAW